MPLFTFAALMPEVNGARLNRPLLADPKHVVAADLPSAQAAVDLLINGDPNDQENHPPYWQNDVNTTYGEPRIEVSETPVSNDDLTAALGL